MPIDFKDLYIKYEGHPRFQSKYLIENDVIEVIVQKLEMLLFSNKGSLIGNSDMGCDLEYYLWETKIPVNEIKTNVINQIYTYIPELTEIGYTFDIKIYEGTYRDILLLNFEINGYNFDMILK